MGTRTIDVNGNEFTVDEQITAGELKKKWHVPANYWVIVLPQEGDPYLLEDEEFLPTDVSMVSIIPRHLGE